MKFSRDDRGSLRDQVYRAKARLRGHELYINESLTPTRQEALSFLLEMRRQRKISAALTRGGDVFYATSRTDRLIRIRSKEEAEYRLRQEHGHQDDRPEPPAPDTSAAASAPTVERRAEGRGRGRAPAPVSCAGGGPGGRDQLPGSVEAPPTAVPAAAPARTAEEHMPDTLVTGREGRADCFVLHAAGGVALDRAGPDRTSPEHLGTPAGPGPAGRALASERAEAVPVPEVRAAQMSTEDWTTDRRCRMRERSPRSAPPGRAALAAGRDTCARQPNPGVQAGQQRWRWWLYPLGRQTGGRRRCSKWRESLPPNRDGVLKECVIYALIGGERSDEWLSVTDI